MSSEPTSADLLAVCTFARRFEEPDFVAGTWTPPSKGDDGVIQVGYWVASEDVAAWEQALYEHHVVIPFDWSEPAWARQMRRYYEDPDLLESADLATVRQVLTALVRAERFSEGTLAEAFEAGVPQAAMRRLQDLTGAS